MKLETRVYIEQEDSTDMGIKLINEFDKIIIEKELTSIDPISLELYEIEPENVNSKPETHIFPQGKHTFSQPKKHKFGFKIPFWKFEGPFFQLHIFHTRLFTF